MAGIADGMQEMSLPQSHAAVQEKRIVGPGRFFGDSQTGRVRKPVARADDEGLEEVTRVHVRAAGRLLVDRARPALSRVEGFRLHGRRLLRHSFPIAAIYNKVHCHTGVHNPNQQAADSTRQTILQPITRICIAHADCQGSILIRNRFGVTHPGIERGARHFHLELSEY